MKEGSNYNSRKIALKYLKSIQLQGLKNRFGKKHLEVLAKTRVNQGNFDKVLEKIDPVGINKEELKRIYDERIQNQDVLTTEYELFNSSHILSQRAQEIKRTMSLLKYEVHNQVFFGVATSGIYNAYAQMIPTTNAYLIILEDEIFTLCNMLSKIIIQSLPGIEADLKNKYIFLERNQINEHIEKSEIIQKRFDDLIVWGILEGRPTGTQQYFLHESLWGLQMELVKSTEQFIVGHEYGHVIAGHLSSSGRQTIKINNDETDIILPSWQNEFEADAIGLNLLINTQVPDSLGLHFLGAELFFAFLDLDERVSSFYRQKEERRIVDCETHPPTIQRKQNIRKLLTQALPEDWKQVYILMSQGIDYILESLWALSKAKIEKYLANKEKAI